MIKTALQIAEEINELNASDEAKIPDIVDGIVVEIQNYMLQHRYHEFLFANSLCRRFSITHEPRGRKLVIEKLKELGYKISHTSDTDFNVACK